tara:strand:- start:4615 stop:8043 length:3429 start_codon:yes stop_codon:yes gene_type:complete
MRVRSVISYYLLLCLVVTSSIPTLSVFFLLSPIEAFAASDTPLLDDLRAKHTLTDPNRNHATDALPTSVQDILNNPLTSRDMTSKISNVLSSPATPRNYNLDDDDPAVNPYAPSLQSTYQDHSDLAIFLGSSHGQPNGNVTSNKLTDLNLEYARSGTRQFVKDPVTGKLELQVITGVPKVSNITSSELVSSEETNSTYGFQRQKEDMYGNELDIFDEGFVTDTNFKDSSAGQNGAARGYRAIVRGATTANNEAQSPLYDESASWLSGSFNTLIDSQDSTYWNNTCTDTTVPVTNTYTYTETTEHTCQNTGEARMEFCEVERTFTQSPGPNPPPLIQTATPLVTHTSCGPGCIDITFGRTNPPASSGYCQERSDLAIVTYRQDAVIDSVELIDHAVDDEFILYFGTDVSIPENIVWQNSADVTAPYPVVQACTGTNTTVDLNTYPFDESTFVNNFNSASGTVFFRFHRKVSISPDVPIGYVTLRVLYDGGGAAALDTPTITQYPAGCYDALTDQDKNDRGLEGVPITADSSFCTFDNYSNMEVGDGGLPVDLLATVPPFYDGDTGDKTLKVNLDGYRCDPTGDRLYCTVDAFNGETCLTWAEWQATANECQVYEDDANCTVISSECAPGWTEEVTGRCLSATVTYQCEEEITVTYQTDQTTSVCQSMLGCVGSECNIGSEEKNDSFAEAMVTGSILDNIQGDSACEDPADPSTCELFAGEFEYCSWETSGLGTDCCEKASGADIIGYIILSRNLLKVNQMAYSGAFGSGVAGNYQTLSQPIVSAYDSVAQWASDGIRSASESIFGNAESVSNGVGAISDGVNLALAEVQQQVYQLVYDIAPDALKDFLFDNAAAYASDSTVDLAMNEAITNTLSSIMAVYTTYQMIKLALTLLTACDDNEIDMAVKLGQEQCFKVGNSYCSEDFLGVCYQKRQGHCCYSSILSRIIMKEAYTQLGINPLPYGNKPAMNTFESEESCPGLTTAQFSALDFETPGMQAGIAEWTGLLLQAGALPTSTSEASLTGGASVTARTGCPVEQQPVLDCYVDSVTLQQVCDHARDANGNLMYTTGPSDCGSEITGGGQIWNAQDRDIASERIAGPNGYIGTAADRVQEAKDQMRTIPGAINCSTTPRPPQCYFGFNPADL